MQDSQGSSFRGHAHLRLPSSTRRKCPVRTLTLVQDQAYTLNVSIFIPGGPVLPEGRLRREEKLAPMDLPAGAPGRHMALTAPFTNCADSAR